jgi:hypothetical protein
VTKRREAYSQFPRRRERHQLYKRKEEKAKKAEANPSASAFISGDQEKRVPTPLCRLPEKNWIALVPVLTVKAGMVLAV